MKSKDESYYYSVRDSLNILYKNIRIDAQIELVPVFKSYGRLLGNDVITNYNIPSYNTSHMDGFAVFAKNTLKATKENPVFLKISDEHSILGKIHNHSLKRGEAYPIQTGGYLPFKSDSVIPIENIEIIKDKKLIKIVSPSKRGDFVFLTGSDIKKGKKILSKGEMIRSQEMGLMASLKLDKVAVFKKPVISIIATGDELIDAIKVNSKKYENKILNTHSHIISCIVNQVGGISYDLGISPDNPYTLKKKLNIAVTKSDLIITIGGTSVGKQDIVKPTINSMGAPGVIVNKVKLDRGRVTGLAVINHKPIIILPGPIQGALNAFFMFSLPLIRLLSGRTRTNNSSVLATLADSWSARKKFSDFKKIMYVRISQSDDGFIAKPITGDTESISLLIQSNGYAIVSEKIEHIEAGKKIRINLLPGFSYIGDGLFMK